MLDTLKERARLHRGLGPAQAWPSDSAEGRGERGDAPPRNTMKTVDVSRTIPFHNGNRLCDLRRIAALDAESYARENRLSDTCRAFQIVQNAKDRRRTELR
jgi:hypothetical protein